MTWRTYWFGGIKSKVGDSGVNPSSLIAGEWEKITGQSEGIEGRDTENNSSDSMYR